MKKHRKHVHKQSVEYFLKTIKDKNVSRLDLIRFLNFCSENIEIKEKLQWIETFLDDNKLVANVKTLPEVKIHSLGSVAYLLANDFILDKIDLDSWFKLVKSSVKQPSVKIIVKKPPVNKVDIVQNEIDCLIDTFIRDKNHALNLKSTSIDGLTQDELKILKESNDIVNLNKSITQALATGDYEEFYSYTTAQIKTLQKFVNYILTFSKTSISKVEKIKDDVERVKHVKLLTEWNGVQSLKPLTILSSSVLVFIDTTKQQLILVIAQPNKTFDVHRAKLLNMDTALCKRIKLKTLISILKEFNGKVRDIFKILSEYKTTEQEFTGHLNKNMILFKAYSQ
jgi:hypothetical protein